MGNCLGRKKKNVPPRTEEGDRDLVRLPFGLKIGRQDLPEFYNRVRRLENTSLPPTSDLTINEMSSQLWGFERDVRRSFFFLRLFSAIQCVLNIRRLIREERLSPDELYIFTFLCHISRQGQSAIRDFFLPNRIRIREVIIRKETVPYLWQAVQVLCGEPGASDRNVQPQHPSLTEDEINTIPLRPFTATGRDDNCSICLEKFATNELVKTLSCHHQFHPDCISAWLKRQATCPLCRHSGPADGVQVFYCSDCQQNEEDSESWEDQDIRVMNVPRTSEVECHQCRKRVELS